MPIKHNILSGCLLPTVPACQASRGRLEYLDNQWQLVFCTYLTSLQPNVTFWAPLEIKDNYCWPSPALSPGPCAFGALQPGLMAEHPIDMLLVSFSPGLRCTKARNPRIFWLPFTHDTGLPSSPWQAWIGPALYQGPCYYGFYPCHFASFRPFVCQSVLLRENL